MIVTSFNFAVAYHQIARLMDDEKLKFISFDSEFTGISESAMDKFSKFDDLGMRLEKLISTAKKFEILQIGLTFWLEDKNDDSFFLIFSVEISTKINSQN